MKKEQPKESPITEYTDHEHDYELLYVVNLVVAPNIGHYKCKICGSTIVRAKGNEQG